MKGVQTTTLSFEADWEKQPINALELSCFLLHFRAAYMIAYDYASSEPVQLDALDYHGARLKALFKHTSLDVAALSRVLLPEDIDLEFFSLSTKHGPLQLVTMAASAPRAALPLAVIMSGGEVATGTFKLPSLGQGIRELCAVFGLAQPISLPSELRPQFKRAKRSSQVPLRS